MSPPLPCRRKRRSAPSSVAPTKKLAESWGGRTARLHVHFARMACTRARCAGVQGMEQRIAAPVERGLWSLLLKKRDLLCRPLHVYPRVEEFPHHHHHHHRQEVRLCWCQASVAKVKEKMRITELALRLRHWLHRPKSRPLCSSRPPPALGRPRNARPFVCPFPLQFRRRRRRSRGG